MSYISDLRFDTSLLQREKSSAIFEQQKGAVDSCPWKLHQKDTRHAYSFMYKLGAQHAVPISWQHIEAHNGILGLSDHARNSYHTCLTPIPHQPKKPS